MSEYSVTFKFTMRPLNKHATIQNVPRVVVRKQSLCPSPSMMPILMYLIICIFIFAGEYFFLRFARRYRKLIACGLFKIFYFIFIGRIYRLSLLYLECNVFVIVNLFTV